MHNKKYWDNTIFLGMSAVITILSLFLGIGLYDIQIFFDYFRHPLIFILNWLPVLLLEVFLYGICCRQWLAYLLTSGIILLTSIGSFYKMRFRGEPFMASDFSSVTTALGVATDFDLTPNTRIITAIAAIVVGTAIIALFSKSRPNKIKRCGLILLPLLCMTALWFTVYTSETIYKTKAVSNEHIHSKNLAGIEFVSKGSIYPFLYSINSAVEKPPEDYDEVIAANILESYSEDIIPEDKKTSILVFQLESFNDLERIGIEGIIPETYSLYHELEKESYTGDLITNVIGGGTVNTERTFLTGSSQLFEYTAPSYSHVWYLRNQGFRTVTSHPYNGRFYSRESITRRLGFEEFWNTENHYYDVDRLNLQWMSDYLLFPEVLQQFRELKDNGQSVFSFTVTTQGHGGYSTEAYTGEKTFWPGNGFSDEAFNVVNDYLNCVNDTQKYLYAAVNELRICEEPVVVIAFGDHKPLFTTSGDFYSELGINMNRDTLEGFINYYSTRYLIWANDAAKQRFGNDFCGEGPTISPCFLLTLAFDQMGWKGSAFMQFNRTVMQRVSVINTNGYYLLNNQLVKELSEEDEDLIREMQWVQYYVKSKFGSLYDIK